MRDGVGVRRGEARQVLVECQLGGTDCALQSQSCCSIRYKRTHSKIHTNSLASMTAVDGSDSQYIYLFPGDSSK